MIDMPERSLEPPEDERKSLFTCDYCGEPIREYDVYYDIGDFKYCETCIEESRKTLGEVELYYDR